MASDAEKVLAAHSGVTFLDGRLWCTCGALLWTAREGFIAGPLEQLPGKSVGETAQVHHLAAVLEAEVIRPREREAWSDGWEAGDQMARAVNPEWPGDTPNPFADEGGDDR